MPLGPSKRAGEFGRLTKQTHSKAEFKQLPTAQIYWAPTGRCAIVVDGVKRSALQYQSDESGL